MQLRFIFNYSLKFYRKNFSASLKLMFLSALISFCVIIAIFVGTAYQSEMNIISKSFTVSLVLQERLSEREIDSLLATLENLEGISKVEYISPENAKKEFIELYGLNADDLLINEQFPKVINANINIDFKNPEQFYLYINELKSFYGVEDILFKENYIKDVFDMREQISLTFWIIGITMIILVTFAVYNQFRELHILYGNSYETMNSMGAGLLFGYSPFRLFLLICVIIGITIGVCTTVLIWFIVENKFLWLNLNIPQAVLYGSLISMGYLLLFITLMPLFSFRKPS